MPEGHTLRALADDLNASFAGTRPRVSSPQGRFDDAAALLDGTVLIRAHAHGKHLLVEFDGERWVNVHLGLIGKFTVTRFARPLPRESWDGVPRTGAVRLRLVNADAVADLRGPTVCALITPEEARAIMGRLGPDPLRDAGDDAAPARALTRIHRSRRSIAELLMDQSIIAGVGNVYRSEILFRHRLSPFTAGVDVKPRSWQGVWADLVELMPLGVASGQILTLPEQVAAATEDLAAGGAVRVMPREYAVYKRTGLPCRVCGSRVGTRVVAGRNLFWCGRCQRRR